MRENIREPERRGQTPLPDRRALGWSEWGAKEGLPVLFMPGAATSSFLGFGAGALAPLGVRLVGLDRPGVGASDPRPDRTLNDWADDVRALAEALGLGRPLVVGFSQGAPFALACAAAGVARAVALVSGGDELAAPHLRPLLVPEVRDLIDEVRNEPAQAEAFFRGMNASMMREMVIQGSADEDRAVYLEPGFDAAYRRALDEGFAQGAGGYARDTVLAMSRWPFALDAIRVPVDVWYGARDASPVHSPDHGASLAQRIPGSRRTVIPDAGGAILWTHAGRILGELLERGAAP